jgi:intracellular sulfur oxidation DsrE/DsrF family protein
MRQFIAVFSCPTQNQMAGNASKQYELANRREAEVVVAGDQLKFVVDKLIDAKVEIRNLTAQLELTSRRIKELVKLNDDLEERLKAVDGVNNGVCAAGSGSSWKDDSPILLARSSANHADYAAYQTWPTGIFSPSSSQ